MDDIKIFEGFIPENACESIIQEGLSHPQIEAGTGQENESSRGRSTKVAFIDNAFLKSYIHELVFANYNHNIIEAEDLQFATYKEGDFYGYHKDADKHNKRVLSVSVLLSSPFDYEGGDLIFHKVPSLDFSDFSPPNFQGSVIVFPSNIYHQVTAITKGTRHSLVQWFKG